jgi:hypothetical protein
MASSSYISVTRVAMDAAITELRSSRQTRLSEGQTRMTKRDFFRCFYPAWQEAFTAKTVSSSWCTVDRQKSLHEPCSWHSPRVQPLNSKRSVRTGCSAHTRCPPAWSARSKLNKTYFGHSLISLASVEYLRSCHRTGSVTSSSAGD